MSLDGRGIFFGQGVLVVSSFSFIPRFVVLPLDLSVVHPDPSLQVSRWRCHLVLEIYIPQHFLLTSLKVTMRKSHPQHVRNAVLVLVEVKNLY